MSLDFLRLLHPFGPLALHLRKSWVWIILLLSAFWGLGTEGPAARFLDSSISAPFSFRFRSALHQDPKLDPRLKIYAFDDAMVELLGREDLSLGEWGTLLRALSDAGASAIYIDKLFGTPSQLREDLTAFETSLEWVKIPLVTTGWLTHEPIRGRSPLTQGDSDLSRADLLAPEQELPSWLQSFQKQFFYGPHELLYKLFHYVGHGVYEGQGQIDPLVRISDETFVAHWSLQGLFKLRLNSETLWVEAPKASAPAALPLTKNHKLPVNLLDESTLREATYSLRNAYLRSQEGLSFAQSLEPGQIVIILPAMFTGNTDRVMSPIGYIPGGYVMSSLLNANLTQQWLTPWKGELLSVPLAVILGTLSGMLTSPILWLVSLGLGCFSLILGGLTAFTYAHTMSNWSYHVLAFASASLLGFVVEWHLRTLRARERSAQRAAMFQAAQAVQTSLLPADAAYPRVLCAAYYKAAEATGGDWYGLYPNPEGTRLYVFMGDVTGHGISSALLTAAVAGALARHVQECLQAPRNPQLELAAMAQFIHELVGTIGARTERSLTMNFLCFDFEAGELHFLNAGHPSPLLARQKNIKALVSRGSILGLAEAFEASPQVLKIEVGDRFFLYTDGLIENKGPDGLSLKPRSIWEVLKQEGTPEELKDAILKRGQAIWKAKTPEDDCTFLILTVLASTAHSEERPELTTHVQ